MSFGGEIEPERYLFGLGEQKGFSLEFFHENVTRCSINMMEPIDINIVMAGVLITLCRVSEVIEQVIIKKREEPGWCLTPKNTKSIT